MAESDETGRKALIRSIEEKAKCVMLCLATSERPNVPALLDESYVVQAHRLLRALTPTEDTAIGLLVYSRGGEGQVPLELVAMMREMFPKRELKVFVPYRAYSAATVIALGADEIVMGPRGHLGPIDATLEGHPHNPRDEFGGPLPVSVEEVKKYFELAAETFEKPSNLPQLEVSAFEALARAVPPLALGAVQRTLKATKHDARVLLKSRLNSKSDEENDKIVENLASEITYHGHAVFRTEARSLGIDFVKNSEDYDVDNELWRLVESYMESFKVHEPFEARLRVEIDGRQEAKEEGVPLGLLETRTDGRVCLVDYICRKDRQPTPQVQLAASLEGAEEAVEKAVAGIQKGLQGSAKSGRVPTPEELREAVIATLQECVQKWLKEAGQAAVKKALDETLAPSGVRQWARNRRWVPLGSEQSEWR